MLDSLIQHYEETKNQSLLARIYGIYTIRTKLFVPMTVMVMQNTVLLNNKNMKGLSFDLKGSLVNRFTSCKDYGLPKSNGKLNYPSLMKDENFIRINKDGDLVCFKDNDRINVLNIIE